MVYQRIRGEEVDNIIGDFGSFSVWIHNIEQAQQYLGYLLGVYLSTSSLMECLIKLPAPHLF